MRSPKAEARRAESGGWVLGEAQRAPSPPPRALGERCKLPQRGLGQLLGKFEILCNLRPQNSLQKCLIMYKLLQLKAKKLRGEKTLSPRNFLLGDDRPSPPGSTPLLVTNVSVVTVSTRYNHPDKELNEVLLLLWWYRLCIIQIMSPVFVFETESEWFHSSPL